MESINHSLFLLINASPDTPAGLISLGAFVAKRVIYLIPLLFVCFWLWGGHARRSNTLNAFFVVLLALAFNQVIGYLFPMPRPFELNIGHAFLEHAATFSFPSNHFAIFLATGLGLLRPPTRKTAWFILFLGLLVAYARLFVGIHFPADMLGAAITAGLAFILIRPAWSIWGEKITLFLERIYFAVLSVFTPKK